ncbi:efflux RND transporter periplasmic adaptor subunit [Mucilaginibacter gotjawali]|uniref:Macrolide export protein MacA n=2 Tax=Mucilaginibacter gotjawali TaxID=1550579 RepID=A0A125T240_9SPHI|nr:efflux RND transporter periplasmic adaptor subunit [Mucilaginibacter gotjawali]MBB3057871.1 HlyD family secretion protein [Mucilaginibacter gotjawali]BAU52357.1 Macrolide export protein MacA [Mucilaginibacter gotjawali]
MKPIVKKILVVAVVLIAIVLVWVIFFRTKEIPATVVTQKPVYGYIAQSVTATGRIEPVDTVTVGTQVSGIISSLYVDFNSKVKKGELLAQLDKSLLQATLDQYKGVLQNAQSQLLFAKNNYERQNTLFKAEAISKADFDSALNTYNAAQAGVASAQAQVRLAQKNLSYADIYSPIDGVILNRSISIGQTVAASFSTPTLFIIAKDITKMEVQANVDEADIGDVKAGDRASFTVDAFINDRFGGKVTEIRLHPTVSANVVNYTTIINAPNDDMKLKPGMTANIIIYTKEVNNAMLIPSKALAFAPDSSLMANYQIEGRVSKKSKRKAAGAAGTNASSQVSHTAKSRSDTSGVVKQKASVWILQGTKLVQKRIEIGLNDNTSVEVLSGLTENDQVAVGINGGAKGSGAASVGGSPFMPKRPSGGGRTR